MVIIEKPPASWQYPDPNSYSNFDECLVEKFHLDITPDFVRKVLQTKIKITAKALKSTRKLVLDTRRLDIKNVTSNGRTLQYEVIQESEALGTGIAFDLGEELTAGSSTEVEIEYNTAPDAEAVQWLDPAQTAQGDQPYLFTQCQAIHARTLLPCQDCPGVKASYTAAVTVQEPLVALMSAQRAASPPSGYPSASAGFATYHFDQPVPIPSYLVALAIGALKSAKIGPRSHVWCEEPQLAACAHEFVDTEKFIQTGERLFGPYIWGTYDLLVLPPSFPYGGMENPCLTFVTPTLLAGDRSLADVVAHEVTHSWFGNNVTNATWEDFWLNEGFTKFGESRIMRYVHDSEEFEDLAVKNGIEALKSSVKAFGATHEFTKLVPNLKGLDPDDSFSSVPYIKGQVFIRYLEKLVGGPTAFEPYLKAHVAKWQRKTVTTGEFKTFFLEFFASEPAVKTIDWEKWLYSTGMPSDADIDIASPLSDAVQNLAERWTSAASSCAFDWASSTDTDKWFMQQQELFLDALRPHFEQEAQSNEPERIARLRQMLAALNKAYKFQPSQNYEICYRWYLLVLLAEDETQYDPIWKMMEEVGRLKFIRGLYRTVCLKDSRKPKAKEIFAAHRKKYHPITEKMVEKDLSSDNASGDVP